MKKTLLILIISVILITGCSKQKDNVKPSSTTTKPTTTIRTTEEITEMITKSTTTTIKKTTTKKLSMAKSTTTTTKKTTTSKTTESTTTTTTTTQSTTDQQLTEVEVYNAMIALKSKYPNGTPWTNDIKYSWKASNRRNYTGYGCAGFAFMLSDAAFGNAPANKHTDFNNIRVGDIIRQYGDTHSVIVLKVNKNSYTVAEGNMNGAVYWGRELSKEETQSTSTYIYTRW